MASSDESWKVRLDQALHQQNFFTDILAKLEDKSKVPRLFIVLGELTRLALHRVAHYGAEQPESGIYCLHFNERAKGQVGGRRWSK